MDTVSRVRLLVAPIVDDAGASLYDLDFQGGVLRVTIEHPEGVDLGLIGGLSREISRSLDEADPIAGRYTLEVSSPGLERRLRRPEHFAGAVGSPVTLKLRAGVEGDRRVRGTLVAADDTTVTIAADDPHDTRVVAQADIDRARTTFEWGPTPKPGGRSTAPSSEKKAAKP
ncbi:MAG: ribosome maturation factor RimP [Acidimicrobiales bacterium]|nr:ribosome maturation factor RimP [Acidimicrobiales bacterium]